MFVLYRRFDTFWNSRSSKICRMCFIDFVDEHFQPQLCLFEGKTYMWAFHSVFLTAKICRFELSSCFPIAITSTSTRCEMINSIIFQFRNVLPACKKNSFSPFKYITLKKCNSSRFKKSFFHQSKLPFLESPRLRKTCWRTGCPKTARGGRTSAGAGDEDRIDAPHIPEDPCMVYQSPPVLY